MSETATWVDDFQRHLVVYEAMSDEELLREADVIVGPLRVSFEPREQMEQPRTRGGRFATGSPRIAIKSSIFTLFTVGDYYDGGYDGLAARLELVCRALNERLDMDAAPGLRATPTLSGASAEGNDADPGAASPLQSGANASDSGRTTEPKATPNSGSGGSA
jgi:hypothetical protein